MDMPPVKPKGRPKGRKNNKTLEKEQFILDRAVVAPNSRTFPVAPSEEDVKTQQEKFWNIIETEGASSDKYQTAEIITPLIDSSVSGSDDDVPLTDPDPYYQPDHTDPDLDTETDLETTSDGRTDAPPIEGRRISTSKVVAVILNLIEKGNNVGFPALYYNANLTENDRTEVRKINKFFRKSSSEDYTEEVSDSVYGYLSYKESVALTADELNTLKSVIEENLLNLDIESLSVRQYSLLALSSIFVPRAIGALGPATIKIVVAAIEKIMESLNKK